MKSEDINIFTLATMIILIKSKHLRIFFGNLRTSLENFGVGSEMFVQPSDSIRGKKERKEGRKEGRKGEREERRKEGRKKEVELIILTLQPLLDFFDN